jgi:hypothetical protein
MAKAEHTYLQQQQQQKKNEILLQIFASKKDFAYI